MSGLMVLGITLLSVYAYLMLGIFVIKISEWFVFEIKLCEFLLWPLFSIAIIVILFIKLVKINYSGCIDCFKELVEIQLIVIWKYCVERLQLIKKYISEEAVDYYDSRKKYLRL